MQAIKWKYQNGTRTIIPDRTLAKSKERITKAVLACNLHKAFAEVCARDVVAQGRLDRTQTL